MNRTFLGTVVAINPADTSNFRGGCVAVSVRVDPAERGAEHARNAQVGHCGPDR